MVQADWNLWRSSLDLSSAVITGLCHCAQQCVALFLCVVLGTEPRASCKLEKRSTTVLHSWHASPPPHLDTQASFLYPFIVFLDTRTGTPNLQVRK